MSDTKHTEGPWVWEHDELVGAGRKRVIESIPYEGQWIDSESSDARLIAAAPDMLAVLRLYDVYTDTPQDRGGALGPKGQAFAAFEHAKRAAIAKATGA